MQPVTDASRAKHWRPIVGGGFHLEHSRPAQVLLAAAALAAGYALFRQVGGGLRLVEAAFGVHAMLAEVTAVVAIGAALWLRRTGVPWRESAGIAMACAVAAGYATWHAAAWLETATATDGGTELAYQRVPGPGVLFAPVQGTGPRLAFHRDLDYWDSLPRSKPYAFRLYRGWSGSWVLDETPLRTDIARHRAFFAGVGSAP